MLNSSLDGDEAVAAGCASAMSVAHAWHVHDVFAKAQYVQLLQEAFMDAWVQCVFERLPDGHDIDFVWSCLLSVLKNGVL